MVCHNELTYHHHHRRRLATAATATATTDTVRVLEEKEEEEQQQQQQGEEGEVSRQKTIRKRRSEPKTPRSSFVPAAITCTGRTRRRRRKNIE